MTKYLLICKKNGEDASGLTGVRIGSFFDVTVLIIFPEFIEIVFGSVAMDTVVVMAGVEGFTATTGIDDSDMTKCPVFGSVL